ncbi:hypothetical protein [Neptuniibacter sp.]|uniref:hypothetical protein n=1 Tax=Neptuniibacter sp. TaxID=1962643 RepID=UPI002611D597|nr:hypothetical protein [Neptuniibacter sp.]MCP4597796.1 hypothetical protein [Neptuniibacter sp.]
MALLTRDQILSAEDNKTETVPVPEWGGEVIVAAMSGFARDRLEASIVGSQGGSNMVNVRAKFVAASLVDEKGELIFSDSDIQKLGKKSAAALSRVFAVSQRLNHVTDDDVEELAKNS